MFSFQVFYQLAITFLYEHSAHYLNLLKNENPKCIVKIILEKCKQHTLHDSRGLENYNYKLMLKSYLKAKLL